jgi:FlaA1/EpsC-like NDP-sugar epimerase
MSPLKRALLALSRFSPRSRTAMIVALDLVLCTFAALLAFSLRIGEWRIFTAAARALILITCVSWLAVAPLRRVYRSVLRFSGTQTIRELAKTCALLSIPLAAFLVFIPINNRIPRTLTLLVPVILFLLLAAARSILSSLLRETLYLRRRTGRRHVLIYGAGVAGRELTGSINDDPEFQVVGFVDDNPVLRGRSLEGYTIWHSTQLGDVLRKHQIDEVLLAIPTATRTRRRLIVDAVRELAPGVSVRSVPNLSEIASGKVSVNDLREIQIEDLLGRDQVAPDPWLMSAMITDQVVMVTGAGGSIGSELCRQILLERPSRIVLAERSELALYLIDQELRELATARQVDVEIQPRLVDVTDRRDMERVYRESRPTTVFHAAAYKHVPLVEADPMAGVRNNILGTYNCCLLGESFGVKSFTLVSTDKAVRPASVMGASKRVCELVILARAAAQKNTMYSAVRFGNVLGSSGSVVPLFRRQIAAGGPVTITHRDATRYFMTIPEAAQLVVQAGAMAEGGDIFLLDMGETVRFYDLAKMMIQLSGLSAVGEDGADGDIEIEEIGLRPGEKLHEELLIEDRPFPTSHPRIVKAREAPLPSSFDDLFALLLKAMEQRHVEDTLSIVEQLISLQTDDVKTVETAASSPAEGSKSSRTRRNYRRSTSTPKPAFGA